MAEMARVVGPGGKVVVIAFTRHNLTWMREELAHQRLGFARDEIEQLFRTVGLRPRRHLVRSRDAGAGKRRGGRGPRWPDVFLAEAVKDPAGR
mgnify:CR=1 FL=1